MTGFRSNKQSSHRSHSLRAVSIGLALVPVSALALSALDEGKVWALSAGDPMVLGPAGTTEQQLPATTGQGSIGQPGQTTTGKQPAGIETNPLPPLNAPPPPGPAPTPPAQTETLPPAQEPPEDGQANVLDLPQVAPSNPNPESSSSVEVIPAPAASLDTSDGAVGLLDDAHQGLGAQLWQGTSIGRLITLLPKLPAPVTQPSLRDLQVRLLLTKAAGPVKSTKDSLIPLRAERLHAMGFDAEALALSKAYASSGPADSIESFEKKLTEGETKEACDQAHAQVSGSGAVDPYWRKALVYCQIMQGQTDQAALGVDLLRERSDSDPHSKDFVGLASILLDEGKPKKLRLESQPDPLLAAMMTQAGYPVPKIAGFARNEAVGAAAAAAAARDPKRTTAQRISDGEFAYAAGLVSAQEMAEIYRQMPLSGNPLTEEDSPKTRAQLFQLAERSTSQQQRAQAISRAMQFARADAKYAALAPLYRRAVEGIQPAPDMGWFAPEATRILLLSGNKDRASFWLNLAEGTRVFPEATQALPGLEILAQISDIYGGYDPDPIEIWQHTMGGSADQAARLYGIYAGLGIPIQNPAKPPLPGLSAGEAREIGEAAQAGRRGETVLLALTVLGGKGLAAVEAGPLAQAIGGLKAVGLEKEARRIALESAIAMGL